MTVWRDLGTGDLEDSRWELFRNDPGSGNAPLTVWISTNHPAREYIPTKLHPESVEHSFRILNNEVNGGRQAPNHLDIRPLGVVLDTVY